MHVAVDIIEPAGFTFNQRDLKRVAMDYAPLAAATRHVSWSAYLGAMAEGRRRMVLLTTKSEALAKHPVVDNYDLSAVEWVMSGAAPLGEEVGVACRERLGCEVFQGYGLTEASPVTHLCSRDVGPGRIATVGQTISNTETLMVDLDSGEPVGTNQEGEVWVRGPQVMKGYLNNPDATARTIDENGWLHTGDVGRIDEEGYLTIVDRAKELIKYKGYQVPPAELEDVLLSHPSVTDAAVIPVPDAEAGELPKAFVVVREEISAQAIMEFVAERVAPHKKIRAVEFIDAIPKSPSGKILRRVLVEYERKSPQRR